MDLHLEGKVVILTGGFKGIGKGMDALNTRVRDDGDDFDVIDAHFHIWDPAVQRLDWIAGDDGTLNRRWTMDDRPRITARSRRRACASSAACA